MKIGAQLFTLRNYIQNEKDLRFTLKKVAEMGYQTVQISGIGPIKPEIVREACDEQGLQIVLTHSNPERILHDTDALIREHDIMGCDYIGLGIMPENIVQQNGWSILPWIFGSLPKRLQRPESF